MHRVANGLHRLLDHRTNLGGAAGEDLVDQPRRVLELRPTLPERTEVLDDPVGEVGLALDAPELPTPTTDLGPFEDVGRETRVEREDGTDLGATGIALADHLRVCDEAP